MPATGDPATKGAAPSLAGANIIFIVKPEEALVLKWLKDAATYYKDSNVEMVLRSPADRIENKIVATAAVPTAAPTERENWTMAAPVPSSRGPETACTVTCTTPMTVPMNKAIKQKDHAS